MSSKKVSTESCLSRRREIICACCGIIGHRICDCKSHIITNLEDDIINITTRCRDDDNRRTRLITMLLNGYWVNNRSEIVFALCYSNQIMIDFDSTHNTFKLACLLLKHRYYITHYILPLTLVHGCSLNICPILLEKKMMFNLKQTLNKIKRDNNRCNIRSSPIPIPRG